MKHVNLPVDCQAESVIINSMRRGIAIVLLIASIPLQFAWAAVHAYCDHEEGPYALHIGYHDHGDGRNYGHSHKHVDEEADDTDNADDVDVDSDSTDLSKTDTDQPIGAHTDCGFCHAGSMAALFDSFSLPAFALDKRLQIYLSFSERDAPFVRPERPQWTYLA